MAAIPAAQGSVIVPKGLHTFAYKYGVYSAAQGLPWRTNWHGEADWYIAAFNQGYRDQQAGHVQRRAPR
jgi:hypothetical protein